MGEWVTYRPRYNVLDNKSNRREFSEEFIEISHHCAMRDHQAMSVDKNMRNKYKHVIDRSLNYMSNRLWIDLIEDTP